MSYVVQFCTSEDQVTFEPDDFCNEDEQPEEDVGSVQIQSEETPFEDLAPSNDIKAGLQDIHGNQIPLEGIHVKGRIMDLVAQVVVFQTYKNTNTFPIEAKYVFPLDSTAAVCGFEAFINGKHIVGEVKEKKQAHREYRTAITQGHGAYLMDQDAPDVFTVSVGNLPPEATVVIKITYITELNIRWGFANFSIPGTVAYWQQDKALKENTQGTVTKVCVEEGGAPKGGFCLDMSIEMPYKIESITSYTHTIKMKKTDCKAVIQTDKDSSLDDSGFCLEILMEDVYLPRMWVEKHPNQNSEACLLVFQPNFESTIESKDITICLDCSNSMDSAFQNAKQIALLAIRSLYLTHKLNLVNFGTSYKEFDLYPKFQTDKLSQLEEFIKLAKPNMGSTEFWKPLHSLSLLAPSTGVRNILLISDGHIQNEGPIFQILKRNAGRIRLFTSGVGATANRHMLRCLSQHGAGAFEYFEAKSKRSWNDKVDTQVSRMESPSCNAVSVKWKQLNANASEPFQAPAHIQALFTSERLLVYGFVPHCTQAALTALVNDQELDTMVSTTELQKTTGTMLHKLTARAIIRDYEDGILHEKENEHEMKKQQLKSLIIELSKEHSIVTQFTSFVAVEKRGSNESQQRDAANVLEIISAEDIDLLPYMDWETPEQLHKQRAQSTSLELHDDHVFNICLEEILEGSLCMDKDSNESQQRDAANVLEIISAEDIDLFPLMDCETPEQFHEQRAQSTSLMSSDAGEDYEDIQSNTDSLKTYGLKKHKLKKKLVCLQPDSLFVTSLGSQTVIPPSAPAGSSMHSAPANLFNLSSDAFYPSSPPPPPPFYSSHPPPPPFYPSPSPPPPPHLFILAHLLQTLFLASLVFVNHV
ncbi:hypothetical protein FKM82_009715 [Ascaphus truei]